VTAHIEQVDIGVEDWIDGASFTQVRVEIHRNPALWADLKPLYAKVEAAEARLAQLTTAQPGAPEASLGGDDDAPAPRAGAGEESLGETQQAPDVAAAQAELARALAAAEEVYAKFDADKETWTLRALEPEELQAIAEAIGAPPTPPRRRPKESVASFDKRVQAHIENLKAYRDLLNEHAISKATVAVVVKGVERPAPSPDGMKRLRERPHGKRHFKQLYDALEAVTAQEVAIPAPHRRGA
jgi:hypothetical protein